MEQKCDFLKLSFEAVFFKQIFRNATKHGGLLEIGVQNKWCAGAHEHCSLGHAKY